MATIKCIKYYAITSTCVRHPFCGYFNALIIIFLIPLAIKGVHYRPMSSQSLLQRNLGIYGLGGLIVPFVGIKLIDLLISFGI